MRPGDIVFTSGGTEANNLAVKGIALGALPRGARHVVTSPIEHESILQSVDYLRRFHGFEVSFVPVDARGRVSPEDLAATLRDDTALVSIGYANNEVGTVQDAAALAAVARHAVSLPPRCRAGRRLARTQRHGGGCPHDRRPQARRTEGNGRPRRTRAHPPGAVLHGGGQERGRRSGTQDVAGAVGFARALELADAERAEAAHRVSRIRDAFVAQVLREVPAARLTGDPARRLPGTASFTFAGTSGEAVLLELERRGVISSSGSACAAGSDEPSTCCWALGIDRRRHRPRCGSRSPRRTSSRSTRSLGRSFASVAAVRSPYELSRDGHRPSCRATMSRRTRRKALASLQAQTLTDWVAILIDDASTDTTGEIFARAAASDPRFRVVSLPRRTGLGAARNLGLGRVETPFIAFLDADDILAPQARRS